MNDTNAITCDIRILVLSSQHEDMLFKVLFNIINPSGQVIATLHSFPLRVISKADGKKKVSSKPPKSIKQEPSQPKPKPIVIAQPQHEHSEEEESQRTGSPVQSSSNTNTAANDNEESILQTLQYQQQILRELTQQTNSNPLTGPLLGMINAYQQLPQNQRIPSLLRIVSNLNPQENALIGELVSMISTTNIPEIQQMSMPQQAQPQMNIQQQVQPQMQTINAQQGIAVQSVAGVQQLQQMGSVQRSNVQTVGTGVGNVTQVQQIRNVQSIPNQFGNTFDNQYQYQTVTQVAQPTVQLNGVQTVNTVQDVNNVSTTNSINNNNQFAFNSATTSNQPNEGFYQDNQ